jgi:7-carboxy-7-deazaguanine synthase
LEEQHLGPVLATVRKHWGVEYVVVTGGEPMIQEEIVELTEGLRQLGLHITVETSGTKFAPVKCDLMSISPKLASSTPHEREGGRWAAQHDRLRLQKSVLKKLIKNYEYQLKFVVTAPEDLHEIQPLVEELRAEKSRVVLMPEGTDPQVLHERSLWLVEICKNENYRFSPRLHIDLYGNRRGI